MDRYEKLGSLGEGTFGIVSKAIDKQTGEVVALKKIKLGKISEGVQASAVREIKALQEIRHPNVIILHNVFSHNSNIHLVYEFMTTSLEDLIKDKSVPLKPADIKSFLQMLFQGLAHVHDHHWVLHRDLKPGNLLLAPQTGQLKIADFGLARKFGSPNAKLSPQAITRWYRPPEMLFGAERYSGAVDIWSVGCIFAEMLLRLPLFPGNSDLDQITRIFGITGTPTERDWPGVSQLPNFLEFEEYPAIPLRTLFPAAGEDAIDLLSKTLALDPRRRITAADALKHPYFTTNLPAPTPLGKLPFPSSVAKAMASSQANGHGVAPSSLFSSSASSSMPSSIFSSSSSGHDDEPLIFISGADGRSSAVGLSTPAAFRNGSKLPMSERLLKPLTFFSTPMAGGMSSTKKPAAQPSAIPQSSSSSSSSLLAVPALPAAASSSSSSAPVTATPLPVANLSRAFTLHGSAVKQLHVSPPVSDDGMQVSSVTKPAARKRKSIVDEEQHVDEQQQHQKQNEEAEDEEGDLRKSKSSRRGLAYTASTSSNSSNSNDAHLFSPPQAMPPSLAASASASLSSKAGASSAMMDGNSPSSDSMMMMQSRSNTSIIDLPSSGSSVRSISVVSEPPSSIDGKRVSFGSVDMYEDDEDEEEEEEQQGEQRARRRRVEVSVHTPAVLLSNIALHSAVKQSIPPMGELNQQTAPQQGSSEAASSSSSSSSAAVSNAANSPPSQLLAPDSNSSGMDLASSPGVPGGSQLEDDLPDLPPPPPQNQENDYLTKRKLW